MTSHPLRWRLRWRLSVLWALEWAITGAILTYLPLYFEENGLSQVQQGQLFAVAALGLWVAPFVVGQVCDRWLASEKYLAIAHFVGGLTLFAIPIMTELYRETHANFGALLCLVGLYAIAYFPTVPLASSLTFRHLPAPDRQFPGVRVWGTVGWVLAGLSLSLWLGRDEAFDWMRTTFPESQRRVAEFEQAIIWMGNPTSSDCFRISALLSFALSSFCVFLPATPPARSDKGSVAPLQALGMFRDSTFSLLIVISMLLAAIVSFYTMGVPQLLHNRGFHAEWVPAVMTIGQISEFPALLLMPWCLDRFGLKVTFAIGMGAWVVRYICFAIGVPNLLILFGIGLNGVCHVFIIIVIQLFIDQRCRADLRASAQNLFAFVTAGIGMPIGFIASGAYAHFSTTPGTPPTVNYHLFFLLPAVLVSLMLTAFLRWFRPAAVSAAVRHSLPPEPTADVSAGAGLSAASSPETSGNS